MNQSSAFAIVEQTLRDAALPDIVIAGFAQHYEQLVSGKETYLREETLQPAHSLLDADTLHSDAARAGSRALPQTAILKLNGGLGTSMGLQGPKSLLKVRGKFTFLDLILQQANQLSVPLVLMNSFSTAAETQAVLEASGADASAVMCFQQHQVPKLDAQSLLPIQWPDNPILQWCPPGHGDIYAALVTSGMLGKLLGAGRRYLFVSNSDNLGATLDTRLLGHFVETGASFMMEVADRTAADRKGGHLALDHDGKFLLREKSQCHPDEAELFQDVQRHRYFNTNNLWLDLEAIDEQMRSKPGGIEMPTIVNRKTVDPTDSDSPAVYQLETAMGAAIATLRGSTAIRVPRSRFAPVKTTGDLLAVRSDAYALHDDYSVGLIPRRNGIPPTVELQADYYGLIDDLQQRIPEAPSLCDAGRLQVTGDLRFESGVRIIGDVRLSSQAGAVVPAGEYRRDQVF